MEFILRRRALSAALPRVHSPAFRMARQNAAHVKVTIVSASKEGRMRVSFLGGNSAGDFEGAGPAPIEIYDTGASGILEYTGIAWGFVMVLFESVSEQVVFDARLATYRT